MDILGHFNYWIFIFLMMVGFYTIISRGNLVKKMVGLSIFQTSVFIFYISLGKVVGGTAPILIEAHGEEAAPGTETAPPLSEGAGEATGPVLEPGGEMVVGATRGIGEWGSTVVDGVAYSNPLPHVLILTAIVVGIATMALALALVVRIKEAYGTVEEDEIQEMDLELEMGS